jgi:diguanylate cyclase (GGDEF)-like protein
MRILIAEDDDATAAILHQYLAALGHEVVVATGGLGAWQVLQEGHVPVVVSDWIMPDLDGLSLCRRIRGRGDSPYTYVILLTVRKGQAERMEGLRAGADDYLIKPVDAEELAVRLEIARRILDVQERLERQNARLAELASTDELTGLWNRRAFRRALEASFALASRQGLPLSVILFDIDHFKDFNDSFGHPAGDAALCACAETLRASCLEHEPVARHGGEEFTILTLGAPREAAVGIAERIRAALAGRRWPHRPLTASFGVATLGPGLRTVTDLLDQADLALYYSKQHGRDRVTHHDDLPVGLGLRWDSRALADAISIMDADRKSLENRR